MGGKGVVERDVKGQVLDPSRSLGMTDVRGVGLTK